MQIAAIPNRELGDDAVRSSLSVMDWFGVVIASLVPDSASALTSRATAGRNVEHGGATSTLAGYTPRTELGRKLVQLREEYRSKGGKFLNREELDEEIKSRKGWRE